MNPQEHELLYPFADFPAPATTTEIVPGIHWISMPLPFALKQINLWLLHDAAQNEWTIVDCGISIDAIKTAWDGLFETTLKNQKIARILATHCHPDHIGLGTWLQEKCDAPLWMTAAEYAFARMMSSNLPGIDGMAMVPHFELHGIKDEAMLAGFRARKEYYPSLCPAVPLHYRRISDNETLNLGGREWQVITGFGHSPEHASLYCAAEKLLISGDMVLPRISTNVSVFAIEPEANPVHQYVQSLKKFSHLPADTLVLPSHGRPFRGLHARIAQQTTHHAERLAEVMDACIVPQSAAEIVPMMFKRELDAHQMTFAMGEALGHLHQLWYEKKLRREMSADSVLRFVRA